MPLFVTIISFLFQFYAILILIRVVLTWINVNPYGTSVDHPAVQLLRRITDPVLVPLQRVIPPIGGTLDISPIIALFVIEIARRIVVSLLLRL